MLFSSKNISTYIFTLGIVFVASHFANKYKQNFEPNDEYELIKKFLLNDSPLYGYNRPKIWIHTKNEVNSRKWKDFYSRNTTDLNQPYIHLTIKTIIDHCGKDFNICLIDDESFSKLIPSWDIDLSQIAEPHKTHYRELGILQLIYFYGGMSVPNSFICTKNLKTFYENGNSWNKPFVCENINRNTNLLKHSSNKNFAPNLYFIGSSKNDPVILELIEYLKKRNSSGHYSNENEFTGDTSYWCETAIKQDKMNLHGGELVGVKNSQGKSILLENLMEEAFIQFHPNSYGIYIPADEILRRPKYQWFAVLPSEEVLQTNAIISKHLLSSIADSEDMYQKDKEIRSVVTI
jgi:hypothetical protein